MPHDPAVTMIAIATFAVLYTVTVISGVMWLNSKFRSIESTIYREINKIKDAHNNLDRRLLVIELKKLGAVEVNPQL